jgi:hypothetical protein
MCYLLVFYILSHSVAGLPHAAWVGGPYDRQTCANEQALSAIDVPGVAPLVISARSYGDLRRVGANLRHYGCTAISPAGQGVAGMYSCVPAVDTPH